MNVAGSHTLSTAGGNFVPGASVFGFGNGIASAGSPKARVAVYCIGMFLRCYFNRVLPCSCQRHNSSGFWRKFRTFSWNCIQQRTLDAHNPELVYDLNITGYLNFLCGRGYNSSQLSFSLADFNYPAITIPQLDPGHSLNVTRTVTNVGSPRTYRVHIKAPPQVVVTVEPRKLRFKKKGERKELRVTLTLKPQTKNTTDYVFGWLTWTDHKHHVRSPIAVKIAH
ncbi:hypothetical protein JHK85_012145 [Glycine max]|uniref:Subtilisin-like protease fibronectin type-III domain-containing protein n=1 Tax=Glycine max TaxID=3847 RepID=A0A0R0JR01_SOYBN|nr:hypothetical protein JHK85_012145 [Glycine max]KAG5056817.1 hypothetical protein JHK86_011813 [Glycine max]KAH1132847.1 hypothetical protein GYH30_011600 [Glycine max]